MAKILKIKSLHYYCCCCLVELSLVDKSNLDVFIRKNVVEIYGKIPDRENWTKKI